MLVHGSIYASVSQQRRSLNRASSKTGEYRYFADLISLSNFWCQSSLEKKTNRVQSLFFFILVSNEIDFASTGIKSTKHSTHFRVPSPIPKSSELLSSTLYIQNLVYSPYVYSILTGESHEEEKKVLENWKNGFSNSCHSSHF